MHGLMKKVLMLFIYDGYGNGITPTNILQE